MRWYQCGVQQEVVRWNKNGEQAYVENIVKRWKSDVEHLSMIANVEQQAAFQPLLNPNNQFH